MITDTPAAQAMTVLLVEDSKNIADIIFEYLELKGYRMDYARDGNQGLKLALSNRYDALILDVMLPGRDGLSVCRELRNAGVSVPVLMLTACDQNQDVINGLNHGADDYLIKPFDLRVLDARLQALHRRARGWVSGQEWVFGDLKLSLSDHVLYRSGAAIPLNNIQFTIMKALMSKAPGAVPREDLMQDIWGADEPETDLLRSHIYQLRNKVDKPFDHAYIQTKSKFGYQLVLPNKNGSL